MNVDLTQFHQTFFDESFEGLDAMEAGLLGLDPAQPVDPETVNAIFRAAHSIKGGAGTFGFVEIGGFTHLLETLLDELRAGHRAWDASLVELLLQCVDSTRGMLQSAQQGEPGGADAALEARLQQVLASEAPVTGADHELATAGPANPAGWHIDFRPEPDIAQQGNDPLRLLRALAELGPLDVECDTAALRPLAEHEAECCPLGWRIRLQAPVEEAAIREVFAWVDDACELQIRPWADSADGPGTVNPRTANPGDGAAAEEAPASGAPAKAASAACRVSAPAPTPREGGGSIRVGVDKIDALINLVGELVITQAMLRQRVQGLDPVEHESLLAGIGHLEQNTRHLQEAVMATRMLPVDVVFSRFPRVVRDVSVQLDKQVRLQTSGEGAELDKGVIEKIVDPLNHIVRNAIDHGIEPAAERAAAGKPAEATLRLSAWHQGGHIVIEVADDGRGLDRDKILATAQARGLAVEPDLPDAAVWDLIFAPGFSTASAVTDLSGRGVGMDVVRRNIASLGGQVDIDSERGEGTRVTIRLPLTLAILDGMTVRVGEEILVVPIAAVIESLRIEPAALRSLAGEQGLLQVRDEYLPLLRLDAVLGYGAAVSDGGDGGEGPPRLAVVVESQREKLALVVDELLGQQQVVVKNLETHYRPVPGVAGATILGDGRVALILDVGGVPRRPPVSAAA